MFKKIEDLSKPTLLSKTGIKELRTALLSEYPFFEQIIDDILHKKAQISSYRLRNEYKLDLIAVDKEILFFSKENMVYPHLRLLHKYPDILPKMQVDIGAIKHVVSGADIWAPGLTSPGGILLEDAKPDQIVAVYVEGKEHAAAIGSMVMSTHEIRKMNQGRAIFNLHNLGDALWQLKV